MKKCLSEEKKRREERKKEEKIEENNLKAIIEGASRCQLRRRGYGLEKVALLADC